MQRELTVQNKDENNDFNTVELRNIAAVEADADKRVYSAREEAANILNSAHEEAEHAIEQAQEEAALVKAKAIEKTRLDEIEKSRLVIKDAEKTASEIKSKDTSKVSKKLFAEFCKIIGA